MVIKSWDKSGWYRPPDGTNIVQNEYCVCRSRSCVLVWHVMSTKCHSNRTQVAVMYSFCIKKRRSHAGRKSTSFNRWVGITQYRCSIHITYALTTQTAVHHVEIVTGTSYRLSWPALSWWANVARRMSTNMPQVALVIDRQWPQHIKHLFILWRHASSSHGEKFTNWICIIGVTTTLISSFELSHAKLSARLTIM